VKLINATLVSVLSLSLSACAISIGDGDYDYDRDSDHHGRSDYMTVTLPSGDKDSFACPSEMDVFVIDGTDEGKGLVYGCRSKGAAIPAND